MGRAARLSLKPIASMKDNLRLSEITMLPNDIRNRVSISEYGGIWSIYPFYGL